MARLIEYNGMPFAVLIDGATGPYIVGPIVLDEHGAPIEGREVLTAVVQTGVTIQHPVIRNGTPAVLAYVDQALARLAEQLGVPVGGPATDGDDAY